MSGIRDAYTLKLFPQSEDVFTKFFRSAFVRLSSRYFVSMHKVALCQRLRSWDSLFSPLLPRRGVRTKEKVEVIYLLAYWKLKWIRGHDHWPLVDGRTWIKEAFRGEQKSETVDIDKTIVSLFLSYRFIDMVAAMDCCPGDLTLFHKVHFLPCNILGNACFI